MTRSSRPRFDHRSDGFTKPLAETLISVLSRELPARFQAELGAEPYNGCYPVRLIDVAAAATGGRDWHLYTDRHVVQWLAAEGLDPIPAAGLIAAATGDRITAT